MPGLASAVNRTARSIALLVACLAVAACAGPPATDSPTDARASATPDAAPADIAYACETFPFDPAILSQPSADELADDAVAGTLRAHLAKPGPDFDFLPDQGWHLVGADGHQAEFVAAGGDDGPFTVTLTNEPGGWRVSGWGGCTPRVALANGLGPAEWTLVPNEPRPVAETRVFDAMVGELSCASGRSPEGRVVGPQFAKSDQMILVIFAVRMLPGGQDCPGAPSARVTVDLGEPLGDRRLLDGGRFPPADPEPVAPPR
jgi:hypothetical protein